MAYFANGTEGLGLDEQCHNCIHGLNDQVMCPVAQVQVMYNYQQIGNADLEAAMNMLIDEHGICKMKQAMKKSGLKFDFSGRNQQNLF